MASNNEASVEEILESIKKVIARDSRESAVEAHKRKTGAADLADRHLIDPPEGDEEEEAILDLSEMELSDAVELNGEEDSPLIADDVRGEMRENLAALAMLSEPPAKPQIVRSGETSLEGMTRELLRPMLAEWLEENLPSMVERMVQAEIARIAGKQR